MKKLLFVTALIAMSIVATPTWAQQQSGGNTGQYGGPTDPLGTGSNPLAEAAAAKMQKSVSSTAVLSGVGPINLRPGGYVSHRKDQTIPIQAEGGEPWPAKSDNSAAAHNQAQQQKRTQGRVANSPLMPPGWGTYTE